MDLNKANARYWQSPLLSFLSVVVIAVSSPAVAEAYGKQLATLDSSDQMSLIQRGPIPMIRIRNSSNLEQRSKMLMKRIVEQSKRDRALLLWSTYPASIRGRAFGAIGGDPTISGGW